MNHIASDYWRAYQEIVPPEKHRQSKAENFTVEGHNRKRGITPTPNKID